MRLATGKGSNTPTNQMVLAVFTQLINCISTEHDSSFLASLYKCFSDSLRVIGGPNVLPREFAEGIIEATKQQLQAIADRRKGRANRVGADGDREELALLEEIEDFALEDMGKMLSSLDVNHPLLIAVSGVRD